MLMNCYMLHWVAVEAQNAWLEPLPCPPDCSVRLGLGYVACFFIYFVDLHCYSIRMRSIVTWVSPFISLQTLRSRMAVMLAA